MERFGSEKINPYSDSGEKREQIEAMFDHIAPAYDFMNSAMSLGQHRRWRNRALDMLTPRLDSSPRRILDIATGTGDVAFALARRFPNTAITGLDLSEGMLRVARHRLETTPLPGKTSIEFLQGDSLDLPFADGSFDLVTVAYGVRNFADIRRGLTEIRRVMRPGALLCVIELSVPASSLPRIGYNLYTRLIPLAGRLIAGDSDAYTYLPRSIAAAPQRDRMTSLMKECGFRAPQWKSLSLGALCIYTALA